MRRIGLYENAILKWQAGTKSAKRRWIKTIRKVIQKASNSLRNQTCKTLGYASPCWFCIGRAGWPKTPSSGFNLLDFNLNWKRTKAKRLKRKLRKETGWFCKKKIKMGLKKIEKWNFAYYFLKFWRRRIFHWMMSLLRPLFFPIRKSRRWRFPYC